MISAGKSQKLTANQEGVLNLEEPTIVRSQGRVPFILIPYDQTQDSKITLDPIQISEMIDSDFKNELNTMLFEMLKSVEEIRKAIHKDETTLAIQKAEALKKKYPYMSSIDFIIAGVYLKNKNQDESIRYLVSGLQSFPEYQEGLDLYKKLTGKDWKSREE